MANKRSNRSRKSGSKNKANQVADANRDLSEADLVRLYNAISQRNPVKLRMFCNIKQIKQAYVEYVGNCSVSVHNTSIDAPFWVDVFSMDYGSGNSSSDIFVMEQANYNAHKENDKEVTTIFPGPEYFTAQEVMYDTFHKGTPTERIAGAVKALSTSDLCIDARVTLASCKSDGELEEQLALLNEAIDKGREVLKGLNTSVDNTLGEDFVSHWETNMGRFGTWIFSRPYLRALYAKAKCLLKIRRQQPVDSEKRAEYEKLANEVIDEMLLCDTEDKFGARFLKLKLLLDVQNFQGAQNLLDSKFGPKDEQEIDDLFLAFIYTRVLVSFHLNGPDAEETDELLKKALERDPERNVTRLLIGEILGREQYKLTMELGTIDESSEYVYEYGRYWWSADGKLPWGFSTNPQESSKGKEVPEINEDQPSPIDWLCEKLGLQLQSNDDPLGFWIARVSYNIGDHEHATTLFRSFINKIFEKAEGDIEKIPTPELVMIFEALLGYFCIHDKQTRNRGQFELPTSQPPEESDTEKSDESVDKNPDDNAKSIATIQWPLDSVPSRLKLITTSLLQLFQVVLHHLEHRSDAPKGAESLYARQTASLGWCLVRWHWQIQNIEGCFAQAREVVKIAKNIPKESWLRVRAEGMLRFVIQEKLAASQSIQA
ncbi:hypothetical protein K493DRAFT_320285 [Basidiobolus meristosporus CBS 931.73]|uniref:Uncharacterized protein n=1 Tax=Basidiobolus meristosporus CBS 931.73 TaxID=1314790 RepID=A0A1Y1XBY0_9FUNG|nr:hypothetical protein K493DRAFT_320285 [Basidiobolus meristosporus CBS 931.73]|eukprot:ORX83249.1 hypothetical protein K493DRAFT_320285 [Basidiobolus meristosporus CBS 931.73]